jgi:hypothetical protein
MVAKEAATEAENIIRKVVVVETILASVTTGIAFRR